MKVKEVFSQLFKSSPSSQDKFWDEDFDYNNIDHLYSLVLFLQDQLRLIVEQTGATEKVIPIIHTHFDEIIERKKKATGEEKEVFEYLQFSWSINAVTHLNFLGEFIYCYDIFTKAAFGKTFKNGETYDLADFNAYKFLNSKNAFLRGSLEVIEQWFSQLYYYSKSFSGLNDWCNYYFEDIYYELNENLQIVPYHPQFLSNLFSWCEVNSNSTGSNAIKKIIEREYKLINWNGGSGSNEIKYLLGLQLLIIRSYKQSEKQQLFNDLENNHGFDPFAKVQAIMGLCFDESSLSSNLDSLISSISEFNDFLATHNLNPVEYIYQRARLFKTLLNDPIILASNIGRTDIIEKILISFYEIKSPAPSGSILMIFPNHLGQVVYCMGKERLTDQKDTQKLIIELIDIENKAFNQFRLLKGGKNQNFEITGKDVGLIDLKHAKSYEAKLYELYNFKIIDDVVSQADSMCQFDLNSFPIQALMLKSIGRTLPINLSLSEKLEFPIIKKVLFWSGFSLTSQLETEALQEIFQNGNIQFEIHSEHESDIERFINRIDQFDPDIVWISSHGEYKHYEPNLSEIVFSETESLGIRDFIKLSNTGNKRRLLFLNICEGGVHSQTGEFKNLGFPNLLTSANQDVLSHLWMAETNFAYVLGVLFAIGINYKALNPIDAYSYAVSLALSGKTEILEEINRNSTGLLDFKERLNNNDRTDWGNIITTGSPAYYV